MANREARWRRILRVLLLMFHATAVVVGVVLVILGYAVAWLLVTSAALSLGQEVVALRKRLRPAIGRKPDASGWSEG